MWCLLICLFYQSCSFISRTFNGAKKPEIENEASIREWLSEVKVIEEPVVCLKPDKYMDYFIPYMNIPLLFDRQTGNYVAAGFSNGEFCPKDVDQVFLTILPYHLLRPRPENFIIFHSYTIVNDSTIHSTDTTQLDLYDFTRAFSDLKGKPFSISQIDSSDYILFIPFAKCFGKNFQKKSLHDYTKAAHLNKRARVKVVLINYDKQEWWGQEWKDRLNIKI